MELHIKELYYDIKPIYQDFFEKCREIEKINQSELLKLSDFDREFHKTSYKVIENKYITL